MRVFLICVLIWSFSVNGQIVINEFSCANISGPVDFSGDRNDWIEFYNNSGAAVNLTGYFLSDKPSKPNKWEFPSGIIPANGHLIVHCSGKDGLFSGELHTNFGLVQTSDEWIILSAPNGAVVDSLKINKPNQADHSYGRIVDGHTAWGVFLNPSFGTSNNNVINYYTPAPNYSIPSGFYSGPQIITLTSTNPNVVIRYTTDGSEPNTASPVYSAPISINATTVLRSKAFPTNTNGVAPSFIETNTYFINTNHNLPVLSICGDDLQPFLENSIAGAFTSNFKGAFELYESNQQLVSEGQGDYNKHGNDSWAYGQRGFDFIMRDQLGYDYAIRHQIFPNKSRDKFQRIIVKAAANDNVSFEPGGAHIRDAYVHTLSQIGKLRMDERTSRFCVVYLNGQYWGIYDIREKVDDNDFTAYYYDQKDIDFIKTWGGTWAEYGSLSHWNDLYNFIDVNNMGLQTNYDYVDSLYNVGSLIDYVVLNSYTVCSDWLNWNTAWWHGHNPDGDKKKFRYALWDMDATFGHYINYTNIPSTDPTADPCNPELLAGTSSDPEGHMAILNKLMANPIFEQAYISRYIDLSNTIFSCDNMIAILDSMAAVIRPEMANQTARWGSSVSQWETNLAQMKSFIQDRCAALSTGLIGCYNLSGPYNVTFDVTPPNSGEIKTNSVWLPFYIFNGTLYGGLETYLIAKAENGFSFDHWESQIHGFNNAQTPTDTVEFLMDDEIVAFFTEIPEDEPQDSVDQIANYTGFHLPTGFSPNGDGINDMLNFFVGNDVVNFNLAIYDRWGTEIFRSDLNNHFWDGKVGNQLVNAGVYAYGLQYTLTSGQVVTKSGNITLIR
ncbi:MAG: CotH kinase family protein [Putridiphycobacter sp.]|nr:CotH kinase family protein [Putridiphycobacter sp.]